MTSSLPNLKKPKEFEDCFIYPHPDLNKTAGLTIVDHLSYSSILNWPRFPATLLDIGLTGNKRLCVKVMDENNGEECYFVCHTAALLNPFFLYPISLQTNELQKGWRQVNSFHRQLLWKPYKHIEVIDRPASKMKAGDLIGYLFDRSGSLDQATYLKALEQLSQSSQKSAIVFEDEIDLVNPDVKVAFDVLSKSYKKQ